MVYCHSVMPVQCSTKCRVPGIAEVLGSNAIEAIRFFWWTRQPSHCFVENNTYQSFVTKNVLRAYILKGLGHAILGNFFVNYEL